jgi:Domain of unknown function (DUF4406)
MKVYLAGPMSGIPQFNFPAFYAAAAHLRQDGFDVVSPAEMDDAEDAGAAMKSVDGSMHNHHKTWGDFLARDVKMLADSGIEGMVFLPSWTGSRGAKLEATVGLLCNYQFFAEYKDGATVPRDKEWVKYQLNVAL